MGFLSKVAFKINCFKCERLVKAPYVVCSGCKELQRIPKVNYFELFDIANADIHKPKDLKKKYIQLQSLAHPDRHNNEQSAQSMSSFISNGYNVINNSFNRAEYALKLEDVEITDFDKVPSEFLSQIMDFQEEESDGSEVTNMIKQLEQQFWEFYAKKDFASSKSCLLKWKFLQKI